jgi:hypothetical protein
MIKYIRKKDAISGRLHDEMVMMDIEQGKYFSLNPVSTRIWDMLEQPKAVKEISDLLLDEFEVAESQCLSEVDELLKKLLKFKLVEKIEFVES